MIEFFIIMLFLIFFCFFLIWYTTIYNKFQIFIIKINEAEASIDTILRKRFDLLNKTINIIKNNIENDENILSEINNLRSKNISNFDLDRKLYDIINEYESFKNKYPILNDNEELNKIDEALKESEYEMKSFRKYYNDIITEYNKLIKKAPTNIVAKLSHTKEKTYFDGKNMNDKNINDFKL